MRSLRTLLCNEPDSELRTNSAFVAAVAELPLLSTLALHPGGSDVANFFTDLIQLPALTCLTTSSPTADTAHVSLVPLAHAPTSELHLQSPRFEINEFVDLFTAPTLRLLCLSLDHANGAESLAVSGSEWLAVFTALRDLTSLRITNFASVDLILLHMAATPSLRWLECAVELGPIRSFEQAVPFPPPP